MAQQPLNLRILFWNAQGLHNKIQELRDFLSHGDIDIVLLQETKLHKSCSYNIANYVLHRTDRPGTPIAGGTAIYIKRTIVHHVVTDTNLDELEATTIMVTGKNENLLVSSAYIKPSIPFPANDFRSLLARNSKAIIAGDFNAHHLAWGNRNCPRGVGLVKLLFDTNTKLIVPPKPTRHGETSSSTIDFALINNFKKTPAAQVLEQFTSDHWPVLFNLDEEALTIKNPDKFKTNWVQFTEHLIDGPFSMPDLSTADSVEEEADAITNQLMGALTAAQTKINSDHRINLPPDIRANIRLRNKARKRFLTTRSPRDRQHYYRLAAVVKREIRKFSDDRWNDYIQELSEDSSSTWKAVKRLKNKKVEIPPLRLGRRTAYLDNEKANILAEQYKLQFSNDPTDQDSEETDSSDTDSADSSLSQPTQNHDNLVSVTVQELLQNSPSHRTRPTTPTEVLHIIERLKSNKSPGPDRVTNSMLKNIPLLMLYKITHLINGILACCHFPTQWKKAIVCPILKQHQDRSDPASYRPISLLSALSKLAERVILNRLNEHLYSNDILMPEQFGFRAKHSTVHQLTRVVEHLSENIKKNLFTAILLLDLKKAFDKVWHEGLLFKLHKTNLPDALLHLLHSYLNGRSFQVKVNNELSVTTPIASGVPQGSILGPTLFSIYANDVPRDTKTTLALFADDTAIIGSAKKRDNLPRHMQRHVDKVTAWLNKWKLHINPRKCQAIFFKKRKLPTRLQVNGVPIDWDTHAKYLGVNLDRNLTWKKHIDLARKKMQAAYSTLAPLMTSKKLSNKVKVLLYKTIIRPTGTYASSVWGYAARTNLDNIEAKQSTILRKIRKGPTFLKNTIIRKDLRVPTIRQFIFKTAKKYYRNLGSLPNEAIAEIPDYDHTHPNFRKRPKAVLSVLAP